MIPATSGVDLRAAPRRVRDLIELVSAMRFAISLLTLICIASVIGTVVPQREPLNNYVNQFGPFWADVFAAAGLHSVYSTWWFLLILAVLVTSTSLCIARNAPKIVTDLRTLKENLREQALSSFHHRGNATLAESPSQALERVSALLVREGWHAKAQVREHGTMVAARRGAINRVGYIAAHSAIVLICIGGLLDGDLIVRLQMAVQGKQAFNGANLADAIDANRLSASTPAFRANLFVPEGRRSGTAVINTTSGSLLQQLPFDIELKKFIVDYYSTGMPKLFASEIVIHDHESGQTTATTVKVNEPALHRGIAIYQSSFEDGGSAITARAIPMGANRGRTFQITGTIGDSTVLSNTANGGADHLTLEFTGLRVINVENTAGAALPSSTDVRRVDLTAALDKHLGSGAKVDTKKALQNVGPSLNYKLRDASGQAREFNNYMLPIELEGTRVFLAGVRDSPAENFRYLRIPADETGGIEGWVRLRDALADPVMRERAVDRYVARATPTDKPQMAPQLRVTTARMLNLFAGAESARPDQGPPTGGLAALSDFLETSVPAAERQRISEVLLRILNGGLFELANLAREQAQLTPLAPSEQTQSFMTLAVMSLSDSRLYPAPVLLQLSDFKQVQASVFQVARAPGKTLVYLGAVLLIVGVFAMLYVRERRLWIWISPLGDGRGTRMATALSTTRRTLDADAEFERLKASILRTSSS